MKVFTANRLLDGEVVWMTQSGGWADFLPQAWVYEPQEHSDAAHLLAKQAENEQVVVGAYEIDVEEDAGRWVPVKLKELIRAAGPTTRKDLGKQAQAGAAAAGAL
ncbi:DUF2849 domain-containing protein [Polycladidibacter hongkongensis]|uniref:DUF2849 domain-containing protein n=1 Tax=Polycladidibacter hongkongensis TaxID=1647556 RepID=UPI00082D0935|nr:DUF2849 domain-containing protein [Pseudovibrio hongkongensis]